QNGKVVVQDVCSRYNMNNQGRSFQGNNAKGVVAAGNAGGFRLLQGQDAADASSGEWCSFG
ncbi:hypothetical protein Tco_0354419, partial [Tanacetum coccineum]